MRLIAVRTLSPIIVPPAAAAFSPRPIHRLPAMASSLDKGAGGSIQTARSDEGTKPEASKKAPPAPEPPEKPLPGDCCGSGCVRCVWDVYYEELEAYNKSLALLNSDADTNSKSGSA